MEGKSWKTSRAQCGTLGKVIAYGPDVPDSPEPVKPPPKSTVRAFVPSLRWLYSILLRSWTSCERRSRSVNRDCLQVRNTRFVSNGEHRLNLPCCTELVAVQNDLLTELSSNRDLYLTRTPLESQQSLREAISLHFLNHITKCVAMRRYL